MKKFYSVKETAKILGVSTNTVYKYVDTGSLTVRRLGRGRIKIPYSSLSLIADLGTPAAPTFSMAPEKEVSLTISQAKAFDGGANAIKFGVNDIVFFRIFRGLVLLGLGVIYLADQTNLFAFTKTFSGESVDFLLSMVPFALIFAGLISIFYDFRHKSSVSSRLLVHIFNSLVFVFFVITWWLSGNFGQIVFVAPLGILAISHIARGIFPQRKSNFYDEFLRYGLLLALFGGALIASRPDFFPIPSLVPLINENRYLFSFTWFFGFIPPAIYFLSPYGRNSKAIPPFFALWSAIGMVFATESTVLANWDIAYMSYLVSAFGILFVLFSLLKLEISYKKLPIFIYLFGWIGISLLLGLGVVKASQNQLLETSREEARLQLTQVKKQVDHIFANQKQVLVEFSGHPETISAVKGSGGEDPSLVAKQIFDRTTFASRVVVYDKDGVGIGVYPVNSLAQGADYSTRDYFLIAKSTYTGYITSVFDGIFGTPAVVQAEPVFENNQFVGLLGIAINVETFSKTFDPVLADDTSLMILDENGIVVYSGLNGGVGKRADLEVVVANKKTGEIAEGVIDLPRWKSFKTINYYPIYSKINNLNVNLSILFIVNLLISLGFGFVVTSSRDLVFAKREGAIA